MRERHGKDKIGTKKDSVTYRTRSTQNVYLGVAHAINKAVFPTHHGDEAAPPSAQKIRRQRLLPADPVQHGVEGVKSGRLEDQAALDLATCVAIASINGGFRQS